MRGDVDPVIADGHTYERDPIARWLQRHSTSPMTGENLPDFTLRPNHSMRSRTANYGEVEGGWAPIDDVETIAGDANPFESTAPHHRLRHV